MYFIEDEKELIGKEIAFTCFAQFADAMVIVTKDKGIFIFDREDGETEIYQECNARSYIFSTEYIRERLNESNIITKKEIDDYNKKIMERWRKWQELEKKEQEKREKETYLRLKEKYEGKSFN